MGEQYTTTSPATIFYSYAHADERLRKQLEKHLSLLRQKGSSPSGTIETLAQELIGPEISIFISLLPRSFFCSSVLIFWPLTTVIASRCETRWLDKKLVWPV